MHHDEQASERDANDSFGALAKWRSLILYPLRMACTTAELSSRTIAFGILLPNKLVKSIKAGESSSYTPSLKAFNSASAVLLATCCCLRDDHAIGQKVPFCPRMTRNKPLVDLAEKGILLNLHPRTGLWCSFEVHHKPWKSNTNLWWSSGRIPNGTIVCRCSLTIVLPGWPRH